MMIRNMFADDINRNIGGVVRVDQDDTHVILQEVNEYVITRELRRRYTYRQNRRMDFGLLRQR